MDWKKTEKEIEKNNLKTIKKNKKKWIEKKMNWKKWKPTIEKK